MSLASAFGLKQLSALGTAVHVKFVTARHWLARIEILLDRLLFRISAAVQSIVSRVLVPIQKVFVADGAVIVLTAVSLVLAHVLLVGEVLVAFWRCTLDLSTVRHGGDSGVRGNN